jgi:predicted nucleic acid-binding protein
LILAPEGVLVVCDANVLYKSLLRDLMMRLGMSGALRPRWTQRIHEEWMRNLRLRLPATAQAAVERTRHLMDLNLPEALVTVSLMGDHALPDPDDQHVLDAALSAGASVLLTFNLKDFPREALPSHLLAVHPDDFLVTCLEQQQGRVLTALQELRADLKKPPFSGSELLAALERAELPTFALKLREHVGQF